MKILLPLEPIQPKPTVNEKQALLDYFDSAWRIEQAKRPHLCITDKAIVTCMRQVWYGELQKLGYNRRTCSTVAGVWYKKALKNHDYIRKVKNDLHW